MITKLLKIKLLIALVALVLFNGVSFGEKTQEELARELAAAQREVAGLRAEQARVHRRHRAEVERVRKEGAGEVARIGGDAGSIIRELERVNNELEREVDRLQKEYEYLVGELGARGVYVAREIGTFPCNIIVEQSNDSNRVKKEMFGKVSRDMAQGMWGELRGSEKELRDSKESYKSEEVGAITGYTMELNDGLTICPFIRADKNYMKQRGKREEDSGEVNNVGLGLVVSLERDEFYIKTALTGARGAFETSRIEGCGGKARADFSLLTGLFGIEAGYFVPVNKKITVTPRLGLTVTIINREKYTERGGANALRMEAISMSRSIIELGVTMTGEVNSRLCWNVGIGCDILLSGMKERAIGHGQRELYGNTDEIGVAYVGEDDVLLVSNNIEQGRVTGVGDLGLKYAASKYIDVTAGIRVERGKNYQDCCGRVGMKYKFDERKRS